MDLNKLSTGDKVIGISGILLFIFGFLPWFGLSGGSQNAWDYFFVGVIPVLIGLALVALVAIRNFTSTELPKLGSITWAQVELIAAGLAFLLIVIKLIAGSSVGNDVVSVDLDRKYGIFLAAIAAAGLVGGAFLNFQTERAGGGTAPGSAGKGPTV